MSLTARQLNRATLERQLLLRRERLPAAEAVGRVMALQAQEPASPYLALWNRLEGFEPAELERAFDEGAVVKAPLMRITLHAVTATDYPVFHAAMRPSLRGSRLYDRRFRTSGLSIADVDRLEPDLLASSRTPRTSAQMAEALAPHVGERAKRAWWAYRTYAPFHHVPTGGPWSFGQRTSFVAAPRTLPAEAHEAAIDELTERYLRAFGPAGVADVAQFTLLTRNVVRAALERLGERLTLHDGPDGERLYDAAGNDLPGDEPAPPRLLPMWESILLAYADRSRVIPPDYRSLVIRRNGDVLPTLLVDGRVAGVWRLRHGTIEATAFGSLGRETWRDLADEASALLELLGTRDPELYLRYHRWWDRLPRGEVRILPDEARG